MPCKQCNGALELTQSSGGVKEGQFTEQYKCVQCGATGRISGHAEDPAHQWRHSGRAFNDY